MYKLLIRPILFLVKPETVHHLIMTAFRLISLIPPYINVIKKAYRIHNSKVKPVHVFGLDFPHPVGLAAGFDKDAKAFNVLQAFGFSHIEIGTVTPKAQSGNPKPRLFRMVKNFALINRMGFNNHGVYETAKNLKKRKPGLIIGGNIGKNTTTPLEESVSDYLECFKSLYGLVDYFVVNVSCPNVKGLHKLQDKDALLSILSALTHYRSTQVVYTPVLLKIAPDLTNELIDDSLAVIEQCGLDGVVATNTTTSREGLTNYTSTEIEKIGNGGLSGKPLTVRSTEVIRYISQKTNGKLPIIGVGGIMSVTDAKEKLDAGASLIQIYTGFIYEGPGFVKNIVNSL